MNWKAILATSRKYTPLETALLDAVQANLPGQTAELIRKQRASINHIQRILDWEEIDFYHLRFPRRVHWDPAILFPNMGEFKLATISYAANGTSLTTTLFCVQGHIFSLETQMGIKQHSFAQDIQIHGVHISDETMKNAALT
jgi:hypothetical protein